jgi:hypothetical protein
MPNILKNRVGHTFGRLTVISRANNIGKQTAWNCLCVCGNTKVVMSAHLHSGNTASCGCFRKEVATTHGMTHTKTFRTWTHMRDRCYNKSDKRYNCYGGRGISVCDRWLDSFENFFTDMGEAPKNMSIDRINVNGNYCPENCRWATSEQQGNNTRTNHFLELGKERLTIAQWSRKTGIGTATIIKRIALGWPINDVLCKPVRHMNYSTKVTGDNGAITA